MYFKNYIYVDDVVDVLIAVGENDTTDQSFVITGSNPAPFKEFVDCITPQLGMKNPGNVPEFLAKIVIGKDIVDLLTRSAMASNHKIQEIYNFKYPKYQDGVKEVFSSKKS